ncbi:MAG: TetR/AcrR family transcriptional regulator [Proteobacteria bacterium]|nr:MAG: TetR/AcrR family transcriptional regulator [Pseudomonadota bacterium]
MNVRARNELGDNVATKARILDAAERLFADKGFDATSLRTITAAAAVNLAAVNYHFGSKIGLLEEVFRRRVEPLNAERLRQLDMLDEAAGSGAASVAAILRTFIEPALQVSQDPARGGMVFMRLLGRSYVEPNEHLRRFMPGLYQDIKLRYGEALGAALPQLGAEDLYWRMHFVIGTIAYAMAGTDALHLLAACPYCDPDDVDGMTERLVEFLSAGMKAEKPA